MRPDCLSLRGTGNAPRDRIELLSSGDCAEDPDKVAGKTAQATTANLAHTTATTDANTIDASDALTERRGNELPKIAIVWAPERPTKFGECNA
mmetsp:Transcript_43020/g.138289  ORF Transcript_43020/g.138289 Transcript_43020/m.138289 type:complete len:93 (-) Transcript_43020:83-361(-)